MKYSMQSIVIVVCVLALGTVGICQITSASEGVPFEGEQAKNFGGSSPLVIPAAAFSTKGNNAGSHNFIWFAGFVKGTALSGGCIQAPVYLPRWARVYQMWTSFIDADGSNDAIVTLTRRAHADLGDIDQMGWLTTSGSDTGITSFSDVSITEPLVMLHDYSYYVTTCLASENLKLYSVRLYFTEETIFVDAFERGDTSGWSVVSP